MLKKAIKIYLGKYLNEYPDEIKNEILEAFFNAEDFINSKRIANQKETELNAMLQIELINWNYSLLTSMMMMIFSDEEYTKKAKKYFKNHKQINFFIRTNITTLANLLLSIQELALSGQIFAVKILFRTLIEIGNQFIVVMTDDEYLSMYYLNTSNDDEHTKNWYKNFKPKIMNKKFVDVVDKYLGHDIGRIIEKNINTQYQRLSMHCHGNALALLTSTWIPQNKDDDNMKLSYGGLYSEELKDTLTQIIFYISVVIHLYHIIIVDSLDLPLQNFVKDGKRTALMVKVNEFIFKEFVVKYYEEKT